MNAGSDSFTKQALSQELAEHKLYIANHGEDLPECATESRGQRATHGTRKAREFIDNHALTNTYTG